MSEQRKCPEVTTRRTTHNVDISDDPTFADLRVPAAGFLRKDAVFRPARLIERLFERDGEANYDVELSGPIVLGSGRTHATQRAHVIWYSEGTIATLYGARGVVFPSLLLPLLVGPAALAAPIEADV